jgi:beta-fructofuranosidase
MDNLYQNVHSGLYMLGKLDFETGRYQVDKIGELDNGFDFYAAQTMHMPDDRAILIAWKEMWDRNYPTQAEGWAGTYSFPRELSIDGDMLIQKPVRELDAFCQNRVACDSLSVTDGEISVPGVSGAVARIRVTLEPGTASKAGVKLFAGEKHETVVYFDKEEGVLAIDRSKSGIPMTGKEENVNVRKLDIGHPESIALECLLDVSTLEVFVDGGRHVMTANVYPDPEDVEVRFFAEGGSAGFKNIEKFDVVL